MKINERLYDDPEPGDVKPKDPEPPLPILDPVTGEN